jgi:hypothetical protein
MSRSLKYIVACDGLILLPLFLSCSPLADEEAHMRSIEWREDNSALLDIYHYEPGNAKEAFELLGYKTSTPTVFDNTRIKFILDNLSESEYILSDAAHLPNLSRSLQKEA